MNLLILMVNVGHMNHTGILWEMEFGKYFSFNILIKHSLLCTETVVDVRGVGVCGGGIVSSCVFHGQKLVGLGPAYPVDDHHVFLKVPKLKPPKNHHYN